MQSFNFAFEAIGTKWLIDCYESPLGAAKDEILRSIKSRIEIFDKTYSRFREDSIVYEISKKAGEYKLPEDSLRMFTLYKSLYQLTDGAFTLLIGNTLEEAGYDAKYSLKPGMLNKVPKSSEIYSFDYPILKVKKPYILDFGGLGKGYLVDIISDLLIGFGINSFCVDGGGDMYFKSEEKRPISVGLENPENSKQVIGIAKITNESICSSSGNRRRWDKFHHIINPKNLKSPANILATWVIAKDTITADGLATCLFLAAPQKLLRYFEFEYLILKPDMTFDKSKDFPAELFIN